MKSRTFDVCVILAIVAVCLLVAKVVGIVSHAAPFGTCVAETYRGHRILWIPFQGARVTLDGNDYTVRFIMDAERLVDRHEQHDAIP